MHPTIDEQLHGALRLLDVLEADNELPTGAQESLINVRRLLGKVARSWSLQLPFHTTDNATIGELLLRTGPLVGPALAAEMDVAVRSVPAGSPLDAPAVATRNAGLRALLSRVIAELPRSPAGDAARTEIGGYLRHRVDTDPN